MSHDNEGRPVKPHRSGGGQFVEPFPLALPNGEMPHHAPSDKPGPQTPRNLGADMELLDEVNRLRRELAEERGRVQVFKETAEHFRLEAAVATRSAINTPASEDSLDGRRYRWLQHQGCGREAGKGECYLELDARDLALAIDTATATERKDT